MRVPNVDPLRDPLRVPLRVKGMPFKGYCKGSMRDLGEFRVLRALVVRVSLTASSKVHFGSSRFPNLGGDLLFRSSHRSG